MTEQKVINKVMKQVKVKRPVVKNTILAFLTGGFLAVIAQAILDLYTLGFKVNADLAKSMMAVTMVFLAAITTGIGIYDFFGQIAGAGSIVPITGFANSMTASALESKSEGIILGIMTNMFKLAGSVIVAGVVSAFIVGSIIYWVGR